MNTQVITRERQVFVDLDGVLADFDSMYESTFGRRPGREDVDWDRVKEHGSFYYDMPVMADANPLWVYLRKQHPKILTGVPYSDATVEDQKRCWVRELFGAHVEVFCCRARDKCLHGQAGDILIDDYPRYRDLWPGIFILHTSAESTIAKLQELGI